MLFRGSTQSGKSALLPSELLRSILLEVGLAVGQGGLRLCPVVDARFMMSDG